MPRKILVPRRRDPYRSSETPGLVQCPSCNSVNFRGRWVSAEHIKTRVPKEIKFEKLTTFCPACRQAKHRYALGVVEIQGSLWHKKSDEIFRMIKNTEKIGRIRNDQERVLWSKSLKDTTKIYVSLPELARHIGRNLKRTFKGSVEYNYSSEEPYLRVVWDSDYPKHVPK